MITLAIILSLITTAFAGSDNVKSEVLSAFKSRFASAEDVTWSSGKSFYEATFYSNGSWMTAYYNEKAELVGVYRNISSNQLPYYLQNSVKKQYAGFWITELFEFSDNEGFRYYIKLRDADHEVVLESLNGKNWQLYQSTKL